MQIFMPDRFFFEQKKKHDMRALSYILCEQTDLRHGHMRHGFINKMLTVQTCTHKHTLVERIQVDDILLVPKRVPLKLLDIYTYCGRVISLRKNI